MYYIPYNNECKINYSFLFCLYKIAKSNQKERIKNKIEYNSLREFAETLENTCGFSVSATTIQRILNNEEYTLYFDYDKTNKTIHLKNDFKKKTNVKFVVLSEKEVNFFIKQNNDFLCKYYLYLKFYCGASKMNETNVTAEQILSAIGYSVKSGKNKEKICFFNSLLVENGFIYINKIRLNGKERNIYKIQDI